MIVMIDDSTKDFWTASTELKPQGIGGEKSSPMVNIKGGDSS